jgi:hypothetical protein
VQASKEVIVSSARPDAESIQAGQPMQPEHDDASQVEAADVLEVGLNDPFTGQLLGALKDNLQRAEDSMTRRLIIMLVLALMYFLMINDGLATVNLGIIEVSNLRVVELLLPIVFAYTYLSVITIGVAGFALLNGVRAVLRTEGAAAAIGAFVPPDGPAAYQLHMLDEADSVNHRGGFWFVVGVTFTRLLVYTVLPLVFLVYCVWNTFTGILDALAWISISCTTALLLLAVPTFIIHGIADQRRFVSVEEGQDVI